MSKIQITVKDQILEIVNAPVIASGGVNADETEFTFSEHWNGYTKTAVFYREPDEVYNVLLDSDNRAVIPSEVLETDGKMYIGVFGISGSVTRTSVVVGYRVKKGAITSGSTPPAPTPDIYAQIIAALNRKQDIALTADISISVSDWVAGETDYTCEKQVEGVTAANIIICDSSDGSVECTAQSPGKLTFTACELPTDTVNVKAVIL